MTYTYDKNHRLISLLNKDGDKDIYKYDKNNNCVYSAYIRNDLKSNEFWSEYNNSNQIIHRKCKSKKGVSNVYFKYDCNNNLIFNFSIDEYNYEGSVNIYRYNDNNQILFEKCCDFTNDKIGMTTEQYYKYDQKNNLSYKKIIDNYNFLDENGEEAKDITEINYDYYECDYHKFIYQFKSFSRANSFPYLLITEIEFWDKERTIPKCEIEYISKDEGVFSLDLLN